MDVLLQNVMKEQGGGKIINMGSQAGVVALDGHLTYGCCKAAVIYATKQFAMELAQYNINVNAISPTIILTPMGEENWNNERGVEFKNENSRHIDLVIRKKWQHAQYSLQVTHPAS